MKPACFFASILCLSASLAPDRPVIAADTSAASISQTIEARMIPLRNGDRREWPEFSETPPGETAELRFKAIKNAGEATLAWRQVEVKANWRLLLNGKPLAKLFVDECDMVLYQPIPPGKLLDGENVLTVEPARRRAEVADDIRIGQFKLDSRPVAKVLGDAQVEIQVVDAETKKPIPGRITIVGADGSLQTTSVKSNDQLAVRPGVIYFAEGPVAFGLPPGKYTLYTGRGFEYSLASAAITLEQGKTYKQTFELRREVSTPGYVACDPHIHTLTHSGHGDCTLDERLLTLAGEGIELPIATDHNIAIDFETPAQRLRVRQHFTPVVGNEFTTDRGHFCIFPTRVGKKVPDPERPDWSAIFDDMLREPDVKVVILNHARDIHKGTLPFGPRLFNDVVGEQLEGWPMRFNAMEVINSGSTQNDTQRLFHDWLALLNRGQRVAPIGSSDSHDVARYIVGQGRTYIRGDDRDPAKLNAGELVNSLLQGRVLVSYGLITDLKVSGKYVPGDFAALASDTVDVEVRVLAPHWAGATKVQLYANGQVIREEAIAAEPEAKLPPGVRYQKVWQIPRPRHDVHLVAAAIGPGVTEQYWVMPKPFQPKSLEYTPHTLGFSGAIWLDGDGDGRLSSARHYAERLVAAAGKDLAKLTASLADYDSATASQALHLYAAAGGSLLSEEFLTAQKQAKPSVRSGYQAYVEAWKKTEQARAAN